MMTLMVTNGATVAEQLGAVNSKVGDLSSPAEPNPASFRFRGAAIYVPETAPVTSPLKRWRRKQ